MSLADVANPQAAFKLIEDFRKRFNTKTCMAPHTNHEGSIVAAHTLSVEAMLRKVAVDAHVYGIVQSKKISRDTFPIEVQRRGIRDVSVFNGFCQKHDRELFACLETEPFRFNRKQTFMLGYRAVARESYLKRKQYETLPTAEQYAEIHGIKGEFTLTDAAVISQVSTLRGAEDIEGLKAKFDQLLLNEAWDRLVTRAIIFPQMPSILATAAFQPFFDMSQNQLQDFEDLEEEMSQICISLIPLETGGAAIFSWLDSANNAPEQYFNSVTKSPNLTASVIHAVLDNTENIAMNPTWYEALTTSQKEYVFSRITNFESGLEVRGKSFNGLGQSLDDWGLGTISSF